MAVNMRENKRERKREREKEKNAKILSKARWIF